VRAVIQRVSEATVSVGGEVVGAIGPGLVALVGVGHDDGPSQASRLAAKLARLRILDDDHGVMNRSVLDEGTSVLVISQFTLYGDTAKGNRPAWSAAAPPDRAEPLVARVVDGLSELGVPVATGRFGARMRVALVNEGPATVILDVRPPARDGRS
jgi:D-aminoacyl-tRNA deacylase